MKLLTDYPLILLGLDKGNEYIYLNKPEWQEWYWSFGTIGNEYFHGHLSSFTKDNNLHDGMLEYFKELYIPKDKLWDFCEIVVSIYHLKAQAEFYNHGGSYYTPNPCKDLLVNPQLVEHINNELIPKLIHELYKLLLPA